jgi:hypothetical protein
MKHMHTQTDDRESGPLRGSAFYNKKLLRMMISESKTAEAATVSV